LVGLVEFSQGQEIRVKVVLNIETPDERTNKIIELLLTDSEWYVQKLCNIVTLNREYQVYSFDYLILISQGSSKY